MKMTSTNLLMDLILARFKLYRYFLLFKILQRYFPKTQKNVVHMQEVVEKNVKKNPYPYLAMAVIGGMVLTKLMKRKH